MTHALLERLCRRYGVPGAVLGVADAAGVTSVDAWGAVLTEAGTEPTRPDHRFLLTSLTKVVTAAQVLTLVEEGAIGLDEPIGRLLPEYGCRGKERVSIAHVLSHTSGVRRRTANTAERLDAVSTTTDHLARALRARSSWPPGTRVEYSSSQFWVLAALCSVVHGTSYAEHLRSRIAERIGADIAYEDPWMQSNGYVRPFDAEAAAFAEQTRRIAYPAGGLIASAAGVLAFGRAFLGGPALLGGELQEAMCRPLTAGLPGRREPGHTSRATERGLGWAIGGPGRRRPEGLLWHTGVSGTALWVDRDRGRAVAFLGASWFLPRAFFGELVDGVLGAG